MAGMLSLKWNNHSLAFLNLLNSLHSKELYCDATIACHGKFYPIHKMVLSTCSEYFQDIFKLTQCKHPFVIVNDVQPTELEALLNYMYKGNVNVLQDMLPNLIKAAEALKIKGLAVPDELPPEKESKKRSSSNLSSTSKRSRISEKVDRYSSSHESFPDSSSLHETDAQNESLLQSNNEDKPPIIPQVKQEPLESIEAFQRIEGTSNDAYNDQVEIPYVCTDELPQSIKSEPYDPSYSAEGLQDYNAFEKNTDWEPNVSANENTDQSMGFDYYIRIDTPSFPFAKDIKIDADIQLSEIITASKFDMKKYQNCTVLELLKNLHLTCEDYVASNPKYQHPDVKDESRSSFPLIISQIEELGWEKVASVSADFSFIDLQFRDGEERTHILKVRIPPSYPVDPPTVEADLPSNVNDIKPLSENLISIYETWQHQVMSLQTFWNIMDELDTTALVIDPESPSRKHISRRILLKNQVSIHLVVSPVHPSCAPKCQLLGPSSLVTKLNERILDLYQTWDNAESIVYNLERILKVKVVKRDHTTTVQESSALNDLDIECAVCYALRLENELPDFTCDYCQKCFHLSCLYDWLRSLPSSRQNAQFIRGDCPYCTKAVSCKVPS